MNTTEVKSNEGSLHLQWLVTSYNTAVNELVPTAIPCEDSLVTAGHCSGTPLTPIFTQVLTAVKDAGVEGACMVPPQRCSDCPEPPEVNVSTAFSNQADCPESPTHSKFLRNLTYEYQHTKSKLISIWIEFSTECMYILLNNFYTLNEYPTISCFATNTWISTV